MRNFNPAGCALAARVRQSQHRTYACHVVNILPNIAEATGFAHKSEVGGHEIQLLQGESLLVLLVGKNWEREQLIFWEH